MKKVLILLCVVVAVIFMLDEEPKKVTYSESEMREAIAKAEQLSFEEGYERGYGDASYYLRPEIWEAEEKAYEAGLERGYEVGYDEGYDDCLEEHGLVEESTFDPNDPPRIKKDK